MSSCTEEVCYLYGFVSAVMFQNMHSFKYCKSLRKSNQEIKYASNVLTLTKQRHGHIEKEKIGLLFGYNFPCNGKQLFVPCNIFTFFCSSSVLDIYECWTCDASGNVEQHSFSGAMSSVINE